MRNLLIAAIALIPSILLAAPAKLFNEIGPQNATNLPEHISQAQKVVVNRRALRSPRIEIVLLGESLYAVRTRVEMHRRGELIWIGHLEGNPVDSVIVTTKGAEFSGMIQKGERIFRISGSPGGGNRLLEVDVRTLPQEDLEGLPDGFGSTASSTNTVSDTEIGDSVQQDLLAVYTQAACNYAGGCLQLEADIATAVADMNIAYSESGIGVTINLVGAMFTQYTEPSSSSTALNQLQNSSDGVMDEVHSARDSLGADLVALIYNGPGCGIGYLNSSASTAFSVTDVPCLVGNRTMAHEIGHNQGAHHDRVTVGGGVSSAFNYGFRRCNDGSIDDFSSPFFRTVLAYPCSGAPRVGRFSNPNVNYLTVPQGVDHNGDPNKGAWNALTVNNSATRVSEFRNGSQQQTLPNAPTGLSINQVSFDLIDLSWTDNADNESAYILEQSNDNLSWVVIASLPSDSNAYSVNGLNADSTYYFRVKARNSLGDSNYSNLASAITSSPPAVIDNYPQSENIDGGNVNGTFTDTYVDDGMVQIITESGNGGRKRNRTQSYSYTWIFDIASGPGGVALSANSWVSGNEAALFEYSTDFGISWNPMFVVDDNSPSATQSFLLPPTTQGSLWIKAEDAFQTAGEAVDSIRVDHLVVSSFTELAVAPQTPTNLQLLSNVPGAITFEFQDQADNEIGFEVRRSETDPGTNCAAGTVMAVLAANSGSGTVSFTDPSVSSNTAYWYSVNAFNSGGTSAGCTNHLNVVSDISANIALSGSGFKEKGVQKVSLSWNGASGTNVLIVRDDVVVATTENNGAYLDNLNRKGAGAYRYKVCEQNSLAQCSDEIMVTF